MFCVTITQKRYWSITGIQKMVESSLSESPISRRGSRSSRAPSISNVDALLTCPASALEDMKAMMKELVFEVSQHRTEMNVLRDEMACLRRELASLQQNLPTSTSTPSTPTQSTISSIDSNSKAIESPPISTKSQSALKSISSLSPKSPRTSPSIFSSSTASPNIITSDYNRSIASPVKLLSSEIRSRKSSILISSPGWRKHQLKIATTPSRKSIRDIDETEVETRFKESSNQGGEAKKKWTIELEPHTAEAIVDSQRQDPVLRHFMKTRTGLYDTKYMRIQTVHGCFQIVCFKKRVYMPALLRLSTISYYQKTYRQGGLERLKKNFIWPTLEDEFHCFVEKTSLDSPIVHCDCGDDTTQEASTKNETYISRAGEHGRRAMFT